MEEGAPYTFIIVRVYIVRVRVYIIGMDGQRNAHKGCHERGPCCYLQNYKKKEYDC